MRLSSPALVVFAVVLSSGPRRSTDFVRDVRTVRQIEKLVGLLSICDGFEVFVGVKIHGDDHIKPPPASSLYVENRSSFLDL